MSDRRTAIEILNTHGWDDWYDIAHEKILSGSLDLPSLRMIDKFWRHLEDNDLPSTSERAFHEFNAGCKIPGRLGALLSALNILDSGLAEIPVLASVLRQDRQKARARKTGYTPQLSVSVPEAELPESWRQALHEMRHNVRRGCAAPAPSIVLTIALKLRQLAFAAQASDVDVAFELPAIRAFARAMLSRKLKHATVASTVGKLLAFARYIGASEEIKAALRDEQVFLERLARADVKNKDQFLHRNSLDLSAVAAKAVLLREAAIIVKRPTKRNSMLMESALMALLFARPIRAADIQNLIVGDTIWRDTRGWHLEIGASKNGADLQSQFWDAVTPFLDGSVLQGAEEESLWSRYEARKGGPFFAHFDQKPLSYCWATEVFHKHFGIGCHIIRTLWHDHAASISNEEATNIVLILCGQRSVQSAAHYLTRKSVISNIRAGQSKLGDVASRACSDKSADHNI